MEQDINIVVTGAAGFIGKNLISQLKNRGYLHILEVEHYTTPEQLDTFLKDCDVVFHLAGVNRSQYAEDFERANKVFTQLLLEKLSLHKNTCPLIVSSSIQATQHNLYGQSKKSMEEEVFSYAKITGAKAYIFRLPNVFGKWCKPNYNSVVATFCHNIARGIDIRVDDDQSTVNLVYIDDVVNSFILALEDKTILDDKDFCTISSTYKIKLGDLAKKLYSFRQQRETLVMPSLKDELDKYLYSTYLSYMPQDGFSHDLDQKTDERGYFCELIKSNEFGQISVSTTKPGVVRGNHWHNTKVEKFTVIQGTGIVRFRKIDDGESFSYMLSGDSLQSVDVPPGYTHSIENIGDNDLVVLIWCNEQFDKTRPDTYFMEV